MEEEKLAAYIESLHGFKYSQEIDRYDHMGAVVVDGILQAGLNYYTTVKPRVDLILQKYGDKKTTNDFIEICDEVGINALINFKGKRPNWIVGLLGYLQENNIQTTDELRIWLKESENKKRFKKLDGIKDKTANYFQILTGDDDAVKIDVHLKRFLESAGYSAVANNDEQSIDLIRKTAKILQITPAILDHSIWTYQSNKK